MTITGYSSSAHDRFSSGYPAAPVENRDSSFVGLGLDWGGVGWASTEATKSFGFVSPAHYLAARHYGGAANLRVFAGGNLTTHSQSAIEELGVGLVLNGQSTGDLSLGTLAVPISSAAFPRYAVLDLNSVSTTNNMSAYSGLALLVYGRGVNGASSTRIGPATINGINGQSVTTSRLAVQLEAGDSGSPVFHRWTNPNATEELTLIGNNAAINDTTNYLNFLGSHEAISALNTRMNDDGFSLRVVGPVTNTWVGNTNYSITNRRAWGLGLWSSAPSDKFVLFNAATAGSERVVLVDGNHHSRGMYFKSTAAANDGFAFNGSATLTLGRGGITNYDNSAQVFNAPIALGSSQYWTAGEGGITTAAIQTNGNLLEISGAGTSRITGIVSGTGGIALSGGSLEMTAMNAYSGNTYVWNGSLSLSKASLNDQSKLVLGPAGRVNLAFSGGDQVSSLVIDGVTLEAGIYGRLGLSSNVTGLASVTGDGLLYVGDYLTPYVAWALEQGLTIGINDGHWLDPDQDGMMNLMEFALGGDPLLASHQILPRMELDEADFQFSFVRTDASVGTASVSFQWTTDLNHWKQVAIGTQSSAANSDGVSVTIQEGQGRDLITIKVPRIAEMKGRLLGRLAVTPAP